MCIHSSYNHATILQWSVLFVVVFLLFFLHFIFIKSDKTYHYYYYYQFTFIFHIISINLIRMGMLGAWKRGDAWIHQPSKLNKRRTQGSFVRNDSYIGRFGTSYGIRVRWRWIGLVRILVTCFRYTNSAIDIRLSPARGGNFLETLVI